MSDAALDRTSCFAARGNDESNTQRRGSHGDFGLQPRRLGGYRHRYRYRRSDTDAGASSGSAGNTSGEATGHDTTSSTDPGTATTDSDSGPASTTSDTAGTSGAACGPGVFETPWDDCGTLGVLQGTLRTSISDIEAPAGSVGTVTLLHRQDIDKVDDGCITDLWLELQFYTCVLALRLRTDGQGSARLLSAQFSVDSMCPGFVDGTEGEYYFEGEGDWWPLGIPPRVQDRNAPSSCLESSNWCFPDVEIPMFREDNNVNTIGDVISVNLSDVTLTGSFASEGFVVEGEGAPACRVEDSCDNSGGGAWCVEAPYVCILGYAVELGGSECEPCSPNGTMSFGEPTHGYCLDDTGAIAQIAEPVEIESFITTVTPNQEQFALSVFEVVVPAGETLTIRERGADWEDGYDGWLWVGERGAGGNLRIRIDTIFAAEDAFRELRGVDTTVDVAVFVNRVPAVVNEPLTLELRTE